MFTTSLRRGAGALLVGGVLAMVTSPSAAAHVDAQLDGAGPGGFGVITLGVPTESGKPETTKVEVRIPDDTPMRTVRPQPLAGWTVEVTKRKVDPPLYRDDGTPVNEVVDRVTWTATGAGIPTGQFAQFALYAGPLPDADSLALPTTQTFKDGSTEAWTEPASGGEKPKFPVPTATIAKPASNLLPVVAWSALGLSATALALAVFGIDRASRRAPVAGAPDAEPLTPSPANQ
ncbi:YcnI family protein [Mycolicibacterium sp.]|uniref:YcnI family copper-binding membrane protein n=1 Tax=Mycolicibacterium sp. TaxID=2320850 RepID=UPI0028AE01D6|nr:YcnI family protein [Mycolicibacterium sp.]